MFFQALKGPNHRATLGILVALGVFWCLVMPVRIHAQFPPGSWKYLPDSPDAGEGSRHRDIFFISESTGWLVDDESQIYRTDDRGETWLKQFQDENEIEFRAVAFANEQTGWIGSETKGHVLFETHDGGETWTDITGRIEGAIPFGISAIWVVNDLVIYATGSTTGGPWFLASSTGGATWVGKRIGVQAQTALDIYFVNNQLGLITGGTREDFFGDAVILRTEDSGDTWHEVIPTFKKTGVDGEWGAQFSFPNSTAGYLSIEYLNNRKNRYSKVMKTADMGINWAEIEVIDNIVPFGLQAIGFVTENTGWTSGHGISSVTITGGVFWESLTPYSPISTGGELDGSISRIHVVNETLAYAVGRYVYRYDENESTSVVDLYPGTPREYELSQSFPNPFRQATRIRFSIQQSARVVLKVYNSLGVVVRTLVDEPRAPGSFEEMWDGRSANGRRLTNGLYFFTLRVDGATETMPIVLLR